MADASDTPVDVVYEMLWDCRFCGAAKLLGVTHRHCPQCGGSQDPAWRYFPSDDEKVLAKDHRYVGVDRGCAFCGTANSAAAKCCGQCGAPLDEAKQVELLAGRTRAAQEAFQTENLQARQRGEAIAPLKGSSPARSPWPRRVLVGIFASFLALAGAIFWTRTQEVTVSAQRWHREISLDVLKPIAESAWCDSVPGDAYSVSRSREQRDSREIPDGEVCETQQIDRGDGTFIEQQQCHQRYRSEPIFDYRCRYTVNRWVPDRVAQAVGASIADLAWPSAQPVKAGVCLGCEREGVRRERYTIELSGAAKPIVCELSEEQWRAAAVGAKFRLKVGALIGDARCSSLEQVQP